MLEDRILANGLDPFLVESVVVLIVLGYDWDDVRFRIVGFFLWGILYIVPNIVFDFK